MSENIDSVGTSASAKYMAFGDDSQYEGVLVFAFIIAKRTRVSSMVREFEELKSRFNFPRGVGVHCRELLSGQRRVKLGLAHLSREDISSIISSVITIINRNEAGVRYAYSLESNVKSLFETPMTFKSVDGGADIDSPVRYDPKGVLGILAQACFAVRKDGLHGPQAAECQIFVSPDTTPVKFIGEGKRQAHNLTRGFSDIDAEPGRVFSIGSIIGDGGYPQLMQMADVVAYVCAHAMHPADDKRKYLDVHNRIKIRVQSVFGV